MDIRSLIGDVLKAAKTAAAIIPGSTDDAIIATAEKLVGVVDGLVGSAPDTRTQEEMQAARKKLAAAVSAKAERTANRFD